MKVYINGYQPFLGGTGGGGISGRSRACFSMMALSVEDRDRLLSGALSEDDRSRDTLVGNVPLGD